MFYQMIASLPNGKPCLSMAHGFPHTFIDSMAEIMREKTDHSYTPDNSAEGCMYTMRCVEAAYFRENYAFIQGIIIISRGKPLIVLKFAESLWSFIKRCPFQ